MISASLGKLRTNLPNSFYLNRKDILEKEIRVIDGKLMNKRFKTPLITKTLQASRKKKFDELEKVHGMGNAITGKGNIKASRVSAKTVGDLTIDLIHDIDQDVINNIDSKVKEWQSKSSYDGNYFEWKAKK